MIKKIAEFIDDLFGQTFIVTPIKQDEIVVIKDSPDGPDFHWRYNDFSKPINKELV